uniref:Uncharacterized protein n=1 Tax=Tanacetum cinerariifolium TaxID=118510 RepID=A0A699SJD9_TANCI|nr:hypothetical protein [Tanacetum cinerariifolium]
MPRPCPTTHLLLLEDGDQPNLKADNLNKALKVVLLARMFRKTAVFPNKKAVHLLTEYLAVDGVDENPNALGGKSDCEAGADA